MSNLDDVTAIFDDQIRCRWYDLCRNHAAGYVHHPTLDEVPACEPCAHLTGLPLTRWEH